MKHDNILSFVYGTPWAILPERLAFIEAALWKRLTEGPAAQDRFDDAQEDAADKKAARSDREYDLVGPVAVVGLRGVISPRPSLFRSGGTSAQEFADEITAASTDKAVSAIVIDIDSPGGSVYKVEEAGDAVRAAAAKKRVVAVANPIAASAAYWIGSQAAEFSATPSGEVGSVGVIAAHVDQSEMEKKLGLKTTLVEAGRYKGEGHPSFPLGEEARAELQRVVNRYYEKFVAAVAQGRRVSGEAVQSRFGQGRMVLADDARGAGMIDRVETLADAIARVSATASAGASRARAAAALARARV